jgi:DNA ligase-1
MQEVARIIKLIQDTSSYNDKQQLLRKYADTEGLKAVLKFIYNPYTRTGISKSKLSKIMDEMHESDIEVGIIDYKKVMNYLKEHTTGTFTDLAVASTFIKSTMQNCPEATYLAKAIVTQDLSIGVTSTTLNLVYGKGFIPKVGCMLGTLYKKVGSSNTKWPCIVTEKLDGVRRVLIKEDGVSRLYSRSGHEDLGLIEIVKEAKDLPNNTVYDGELLAKGVFKDCIAQRQATNSIANSGGNKTGLTFNIFDMVPLAEFNEGISKEPALLRKIRLGATLMDDSIQILTEEWSNYIAAFGTYADFESIKSVPILGLINSIDEVDEIVSNIWKAGREGVMLNTTVGKYELKRSKQLLKIKHTEEIVLSVEGMVEGDGKFDGILGSLVVDYKGTKLGVGSGFTEAERKKIWSNQEHYIGRKVEIDTFGESTNALGGKSLNCPIFKRFVGEE